MLDIENIIQIVVVLVIIAAVYLMLIRPQLKRQTLHQELLSSLKIGDQIVTYGGLIGEIVQIENEHVLRLISKILYFSMKIFEITKNVFKKLRPKNRKR